MEIGQLREEIDAIDKEMLSLFEKRLPTTVYIIFLEMFRFRRAYQCFKTKRNFLAEIVCLLRENCLTAPTEVLNTAFLASLKSSFMLTAYGDITFA